MKDDSPTKNTLEVRLSVPHMERYLGLPEIRKDINPLVRGGLTGRQFLETLIVLEQKRAVEYELILQELREQNKLKQ